MDSTSTILRLGLASSSFPGGATSKTVPGQLLIPLEEGLYWLGSFQLQILRLDPVKPNFEPNRKTILLIKRAPFTWQFK